jgi:hypothetical protein
VVQNKNLFTAVKIMAIGVTWLLTCEGVAKLTVGVGNSNLLSSPVKIEGETGFVSFLGAFAKLRKATLAFVMSVPSARMEQLGSN